MRQPQTYEDEWAWWEASVAGETPEVNESEPHSGYYAVRRFPYGEWPRGPFVPARIWWERQVDEETGELLADEVCRCEVDGKLVNPWRTWTWVAKRPISWEEWTWLKAMSPLLPQKIPPRR